MNKLVLIGNGFDLAHGLKTSYSDFILWYLNKSSAALISNTLYEDELITMKSQQRIKFDEYTSIKHCFELQKIFSVITKFKSNFFQKIVNESYESQWVDIESRYYKEIIRLYRRIEADNSDTHHGAMNELKLLNSCFDAIKRELELYLSTIDTKGLIIKDIADNFIKYLRVYHPAEHNNIYFLNFNYTPTVENYLVFFETSQGKEDRRAVTLNYIHGRLSDANNPIIFGYGDEMDPHYQQIENLNENEFLKNIKSFNYFRTNNYQSFSSFIDAEPFDVFIFGHSCGISDRILLNSIFEHKNRNKIRIFYYKKDDSYNDYFEKTQEISRHFKAENKGKMRNVIIPFDESCPMTVNK